MRFVPIKTDEQLDMQSLHRARDRWVARRTAVMNQLRGFLLERGIAVRKGSSYLREQLLRVFDGSECLFSGRMLQLLFALRLEWDRLEEQIEEVSREIQSIAKNDDSCARLMEIPGVGPLVSTALIAAIGNGVTFCKGRDLASWLGLVPRQYTTGGKPKLSGVSKRGNEYLRRMFLHGARSVLMQMEKQRSALGYWLGQLAARAHRNVVVVALANKLARIAWAVLTTGRRYHAPRLASP
jgi:transposase